VNGRQVVRWLIASAAVTLIALSVGVANAQGPVVNGPSNLLNQYQSVRSTWLTTAAGYANRLFAILALIEFAWTGIILLLDKTDLQGWTSALIRRMMFVGAFFALLQFGTTWIPAIIDSFVQVGQTASGVPGLSPSNILARGLEITGDLLVGAAQSGWLAAFGTALCMVFAALLSFLAFLGLCIQFVVATVESYLVIGAGFLFLGFGGSRWTAPYVERYIAYAVSAGVKIMLIYLLIGAGYILSNGWVTAAQNIAFSTQPATDALDIAAAAVIFLMICWNAPKLAAAILGGSPALTGGDAVATGGALLGGAVAVAGLAAGGVALGAKMLAAKGGAMGVGQAASMGAGGGAGGAGVAAGVGAGGGGGGKGGTGAAAAVPASRGGGPNGSTGGGTQPSPPSKSTSEGSAPSSDNGGGGQASSPSGSAPQARSAGTSAPTTSQSPATAAPAGRNTTSTSSAQREAGTTARVSPPSAAPASAPPSDASQPEAATKERRAPRPNRSSPPDRSADPTDTASAPSSLARATTHQVGAVGGGLPGPVVSPAPPSNAAPNASLENPQSLTSPQTVQGPFTNSSPMTAATGGGASEEANKPQGAASEKPATLQNPQTLESPQTVSAPMTTGAPMTVTEPVTTTSSSTSEPASSPPAKGGPDRDKAKRRADVADAAARATVRGGMAIQQLRGAIPSDAAPHAPPPPLNTESHE
jgi:type IV secretion system protein TrbL